MKLLSKTFRVSHQLYSEESVMKKAAMVLLIAMIPIFVSAEGNVKRETVERLLSVMNVEKMIDSMYSQMDQMFVGMAKQLDIKESEQPIFDKFMLKVASAMREEMTWQKMKEPMIDIYIKHYTESEINDLLAFYSSDSGRSIINKMPAVMQDSMLISQSMLRDFMPKMKELSKELGKELKLARSKQK